MAVTLPVVESQVVVARPVERLAWVDASRGLAIIAVVAIHVLGRCVTHVTGGSKLWYVLVCLSVLVHFAVPAFLLISAFVNAQSLLRRWEPARFLATRLRTVLWPYLLWSAIYLGYLLMRGERYAPGILLHHLAFGKIYAHLYYLVILVQLLLLLPLLVPIFRRRPAFPVVITTVVILTAGIYLFNRQAHLITYVGTCVFWYIPVIAIGLWLASRPEPLAHRLKRWLAPSLALALGAYIVYCQQTARVLLHQPVNPYLLAGSDWTYMTAAACVLIALTSRWKPTGRPFAGIQALGRYSLQIYLAHPLVLALLDRFFVVPARWLLPGYIALYMTCALGLPLAFARMVERARLSCMLFGR